MRTAIITPYFKEPLEVLERCHASVQAQTSPADHFMVADGFPHSEIDAWENVQHIKLPSCHDDFGDTPTVIGALSAIGQVYDAIGFLGADNWLYPNHIETMLEAQAKAAVPIVVARRDYYRPDGTRIEKLDGFEEPNHVDGNCLFLTGDALRWVHLLCMRPKPLAEIDDRIFWKALQARELRYIKVLIPTVAYEMKWKSVYELIGETPCEGAKPNVGDKATVWARSITQVEKDSWSRYLFGYYGGLDI